MDITHEVYIGDGVYCRYDGYQFWLRAPRVNGSVEIALEPETLASLTKHIARVREALDPQPIKPPPKSCNWIGSHKTWYTASCGDHIVPPDSQVPNRCTFCKAPVYLTVTSQAKISDPPEDKIMKLQQELLLAMTESKRRQAAVTLWHAAYATGKKELMEVTRQTTLHELDPNDLEEMND